MEDKEADIKETGALATCLDEKRLEKEAQVNKERQQFIDNALTNAVVDFAPADIKEADTFYTTAEIQDAVLLHTGILLEVNEVFEGMQRLNYKYRSLGSLDMYWLMVRKEEVAEL